MSITILNPSDYAELELHVLGFFLIKIFCTHAKKLWFSRSLDGHRDYYFKKIPNHCGAGILTRFGEKNKQTFK